MEMMVADVVSFPSNRAIAQRHNTVAYGLLPFLSELSDRTRPLHIHPRMSRAVVRVYAGIAPLRSDTSWLHVLKAEALCSLAGLCKARGYSWDLPDGFAVFNYSGIPHVCCQHALAGVL